MSELQPGHAALRRGRVSIPGAEYYLTICTDNRAAGLTEPGAGQSISETLRAMSADGTWRERCSTIMPDHVHLLVVLGERLTLGKAIARLKGKSAAALG